jgi:lipopolysaccharide export system protein LptA
MWFRVALILLWLVFFGIAKTKTSPENPLILKHANQMQNYGNGEKMWSRLTGEVEFQHGEINLKSQEADYFRADQRVELRNQVVLTARGKELTADKMNYQKADQRVEAHGQVVIRDQEQNMTLTGEWGEYFRDKKLANVYGRPVLTNVDTVRNDTLQIISDRMEFNEETSSATALGNVVLLSGKTKATGGRGEYYEKTDQAFLTEAPVFYQEKNIMGGEIIKLILKDQKLEQIFVYNKANGKYFEADSTVDTARVSEISGDTIHLVLEEEQIHQIFVIRNAHSYYYWPDQKETADEASGTFIRMEMDQKEVREVLVNGNASSIYYNREKEKITGRNNASGDTIHVSFESNKVSSVSVFGGARGNYRIFE